MFVSFAWEILLNFSFEIASSFLNNFPLFSTMHYPSSRFSLFLRCIRVFFIYPSFRIFLLFPSRSRAFFTLPLFSSTILPRISLPVFPFIFYRFIIFRYTHPLLSPSKVFRLLPFRFFLQSFQSISSWLRFSFSSFQILISNFIVSNIDGFSISIFQILNFPFVSISKIIYLFL